MSDPTTPPIPKSLIRLCTSLHAYRPGIIEGVDKLGYETCFKSAGGHHASTSALLRSLSQARLELAASLTTGANPEDTLANAETYLPLIRTLLLSCEVQPDTAVLDQKVRNVCKAKGPFGGTPVGTGGHPWERGDHFYANFSKEARMGRLARKRIMWNYQVANPPVHRVPPLLS